MIKIEKPTVVAEDALLMKADNMNAKPTCHQASQVTNHDLIKTRNQYKQL